MRLTDPVGQWWDAGLEWFDRRWESRRTSQSLECVEKHAHLPVVPLSVRDEARLRYSTAVVWAFLADDARKHVPCGPAHVLGFTLPSALGAGAGEVGCCVQRRTDGAWIGWLSEAGESLEGVRDVAISVSDPHDLRQTLTLWPDGDDACILRYDIDKDSHDSTVEKERALLGEEIRRRITRITAALAGDELEEQWSATERCTADRHVDVDVSVDVLVRATPEAVWAVVADAGRFALAQPDDEVVSFSVPGSARGQVGELVGLLTSPGRRGSIVLLWRVVGLLPGRAVAWRALSTDPGHAARREISLEPDEAGVRVTFRVQAPAHRSHVRTVRRRQRAVAERYLAALRAELEA